MLLWSVLGIARYAAAGALMAVAGLDVDALWVRVPAIAAGLTVMALMTCRLRADCRDRKALIRALAEASAHPAQDAAELERHFRLASAASLPEDR